MIALVLSWGCGAASGPDPARGAEPLPTAYHDEARARAEALVPEPERNGPPIPPAAAPLPPFSGVDRGASTYVGTPLCVTCHVTAGEAWATTAHAQAVETLREQQKAFDPACLRCHTTGFGHPSGFGAGGTAELLVGAGCESCHGPGSVHAANGLAGYGRLPAGPEACVACHTHDTSPEFRFEAAWAAIAHTLD